LSKFLISFFSERVDCKILVPCKYFKFLLFTFILKIATTEIKTFRNMALKTSR
jgi:hypothetical protein